MLLLGGGSDIALAIARKFAGEGWDIYLAGRNTEPLRELATDLQIRYGINAAVFSFDAAQYATHAAFYKQLPQPPDITVCVFGYLGCQEKAVTDWQETEHIAQANYLGAMSIRNIVAENYIEQKKGTIIGISSVAGERGRQSNYIYGSAKAGFTAYLSGLRNRLYKHGVHVITVLPGFVNTRMTAEIQLPPLLTAQPAQVAAAVKKAVDKKRNTVYVKWMWRWIMLSIKLIPEGLFKKMQL